MLGLDLSPALTLTRHRGLATVTCHLRAAPVLLCGCGVLIGGWCSPPCWLVCSPRSQLAQRLVDAGCVYFCAWGPGCERAHDIFDEQRDVIFDEPLADDAPVIMTTWHQDDSLDEALWYFLRTTWPHDAYIDTCRSALALTIANQDWADHVERRLRDIPSLADDVLAEI